ncbi:peptidylprolyl isomerase [Formosa sp. PL04]|uniref:FKBP-type peptidyl-prolyl cis-trans isomerase n=1 Tax=Formosa sp. PL04 TaxID=3081755 RepID=UPI002981CE53|nr:peptidylprolyl isomerase [Formosa sp. PL04]MDW5290331.1 peptidylprolyl isomerase [Formosa sp. PL04]
MSQVKENDTVKVHYTGKLNDGRIFDSSLEREPLEVTIGQGMLIPGFENAIIDMKVNEKKTVEISKDDAYGDINKELFHEVTNEQLPQDMKPEVGMGLASKGEDGREHQFVVVDIKEDHIVIDGNHPLAGQDLVFDLEVIEIK